MAVRRSLALALTCAGVVAIIAVTCSSDGKVEPSPNGITMPEDYRDWRVLSVTQRNDNNTMRAVLGNDIAVEAARSGNITPWPEGSMLSKVVWKSTSLEAWPSAIVPGDFVQVEFMVKNPSLYAATGGWGFARWVGLEKRPYGEDASFVKECFGCHTPMKDHDYVFTHPPKMP